MKYNNFRLNKCLLQFSSFTNVPLVSVEEIVAHSVNRVVVVIYSDCPEGWKVECSRDMKQFTKKKDAKAFCKSLDGRYKKGICYVCKSIICVVTLKSHEALQWLSRP